MSGRKPSFAGQLLKLAGSAVLLAAVFILVPSGFFETSEEPPPSTPAAGSALPEIITYVTGYGLAMMMTIAAFALVHWRWAPPPTALGIVFGLALAQIIVHFRCFLHVTLREPAREDLQLILFSTLIVVLMVAGTLVVLFNLRMRMM